MKQHKLLRKRLVGVASAACALLIALGIGGLNNANASAEMQQVDLTTVSKKFQVVGNSATLSYQSEYPYATDLKTLGTAGEEEAARLGGGAYATLGAGEYLQTVSTSISGAENAFEFAYVPSQGILKGNGRANLDALNMHVEISDGTNVVKITTDYRDWNDPTTAPNADSYVKAYYNSTQLKRYGKTTNLDSWSLWHPLGYRTESFTSFTASQGVTINTLLSGRIYYNAERGTIYLMGCDQNAETAAVSGFNASNVTIKVYFTDYLNNATSSGIYVNKLSGDAVTAGDIDAPTLALDSTISSIYNFGDTVTLPAGKINGNNATLTITSPTNESLTNGFKAVRYGEYTARYSCEIDNAVYYQEYKFTVDNVAFSVSGNGTTEFTTYPYADEVNLAPTGAPSDWKFGTGALLTVPQGETITYNGDIDLSKTAVTLNGDGTKVAPANAWDKNASCVPLLSLVYVPANGLSAEKGGHPFTSMDIKIIDAENPAQYFIIHSYYDAVNGAYYARVSNINGTEKTGGAVYTPSEYAGAGTSNWLLNLRIYYNMNNRNIYFAYAGTDYSTKGISTVPCYASKVNFEISFGGFVDATTPARLFVNGILNQEAEEFYCNDVNVEMVTGAAARIASAQSSGLRFETTVNKARADAFAALVEEGVLTSVQYGTLIVPQSYMDGITGNYHEVWASKSALLDIKAGGFYGTRANGDYYYRASIVNILAHNYYVKFVGIGYTKLTYADGSVAYSYADYDAGNARTVYEVAKAFLADDTSDYPATAIANAKGYVDGVVNITISGTEIGYVDTGAPYTVTFTEGTTYTVTSTAAIKTVVVNGIVISAEIASDGCSAMFTL